MFISKKLFCSFLKNEMKISNQKSFKKRLRIALSVLISLFINEKGCRLMHQMKFCFQLKQSPLSHSDNINNNKKVTFICHLIIFDTKNKYKIWISLSGIDERISCLVT